MIHLIIRLPVPYQRTLCRTLDKCYEGAFSAWFAEKTNDEFPVELDSEARFHHQYLSEVGYRKLFRTLLADREAVVILGGWSSPMTGRTLLFTTLLRIPVFIWTDHPHPRKRSWSKERLRKMCLRMMSFVVKGFLACGQPTVEHLVSLGIPRKKITNFPYWVGVPEQWSVPRGWTADSHGEPLRLLAIGRLAPVKQFEVAIQSIAQVNRSRADWAELTLIGDGPEREKLEQLATTLGCKYAVRFTGWLKNSEVFEELRRSDALVLTSQFDAYGVVVLEAMAMGRAVLASDGVVAARDRQDTGGIFLHPNGNAEVLAEHIRMLAGDRERLRQAALAARTVAEKWRPERSATILDQVLEKTERGSVIVKNRVAERNDSKCLRSASEVRLPVEG